MKIPENISTARAISSDLKMKEHQMVVAAKSPVNDRISLRKRPWPYCTYLYATIKIPMKNLLIAPYQPISTSPPKEILSIDSYIRL